MTKSLFMKKHSVTIAGHRTSVTLEEHFWETLKEAATEKKCPLRELIRVIDAARNKKETLSSALRLSALDYLEKREK